MNIRNTVLFDLDGTLIDTAPDFIRIIKEMCAKYDHPTPTDNAIREQVSAGARAMVKLMFGDELGNALDDNPQLLAYRQEFLDLYEKDICIDSRLFDGLDDFLTTLEKKGIRWGIVTNKPRYLAEQLLSKLNLNTRCAVLVCPDDVENTKPNPEPMLLACQKLGIQPTQALYIGDHIRDIQAGNAANMMTIVAKFGYITPNENPSDWGADFIADSVSELIYYTLNWLDDPNPKHCHDHIRSFAPQKDSLTKKVILVTGAGDGIGKELALTYARCGATVLLLGKTQSKLEAVYDQIESENLPTPAILPMDLGKATFAQMNELACLIQKEFGSLDGLVHNAAILGALTPLEMYDPITFEEVLKINLTAPFMLTQALFELLRASVSGSIIFTSSSVGAKPKAFWGAYALSKQSLESISELFTQETQRHTTLRFNIINPGATRTNMRAHAFPGENPLTLKTPADIMSAYVYLMTDYAIGIKGQVIDCQPK